MLDRSGGFNIAGKVIQNPRNPEYDTFMRSWLYGIFHSLEATENESCYVAQFEHTDVAKSI